MQSQGTKKEGVLTRILVMVFLRGSTFYIGFKITILKILNKEIKISF